MEIIQKEVQFKNGSIPALGLGTYAIKGKDCVDAVTDALEIGYRHVDTARFYDNEVEIGKALKLTTVPREKIFLTTKIWNTELSPKKFIASTEAGLLAMKQDYVDLLLVHWPSLDQNETLKAVETLNECLHKSYTKYVGVSNFNVELMQKSVQLAPIVCNQTEYHPYLHIDKYLDFVRDNDMFLTAYCPLAQGAIFKDEAIIEIANIHTKSPGQIVLKWLLMQDQVSMIPKASMAEHRKSNLDLGNFELTKEEFQTIQGLDKQHRIINPEWSCDWSK